MQYTAAQLMFKRRKKKFSKAKVIFILAMLSYSLIHFVIVWGYVNFQAIYLTFTGRDAIGFYWLGLGNYRNVFSQLFNDVAIRTTLYTSFLYFPVTCFISLPLSLLFSYFLFKKVPAGNIFRVIFYLPSILPVAVLTMTFRQAFGPYGYMNHVLGGMGITPPGNWWSTAGLTQTMIFVYCVWAGLGFNIVLLSGAMSRVPQDILEYNKIEGLSQRKELVSIMIPLIWPTLVTTFILGMSSVLTVFLQPLFLIGAAGMHGRTVAMFIFTGATRASEAPYLSAFGLVVTFFFVPIVLTTRWFLNRFFQDVSY
jgi:multiple sugar transport system permease protein/N-acetylglucosamine transport system permease protein